MRKIYLIVIVNLAFVSQIFAKAAPTLPNSYDGGYISARSMAMGGAATGLKKSREAYFYNPASLANMQGGAFEAGYFWIDKNRDGEVLPSGLTSAIVISESASISWNNLSDYSYKTIESNGSRQNKEAVVSAVTIAMANLSGMGNRADADKTQKRNKNQTIIGSALTYLYARGADSYINTDANKSNANTASGNGFSYDLSFLAPLSNALSIGLNLKNIVGFMFWNGYDREQLPFSIRAGLGYEYKWLTIAFDWDKRYYRFTDMKGEFFHLGIEQFMNSFFALRIGFISRTNLDKNSLVYTYGFGLKIKNYEISGALEHNDIFGSNADKYLISVGMAID
ncbi:MAG: hypothetical protein LBV16_00255 [Elusimicrobiota bacterium]|jgi:hypothetical protein|nr:hypothetical protein [Elusimicrobiota bacterium]